MGGTIYWQLRGNAAANKHASIISLFPPHKFYGILEDSISYRRKLSSWVCFQWSLLGKCVIVLSCFISVIYSFLLNRLPSVYCVGSDSLTCVWSQLYVTNPHTFALILLPGPPRQIYCYSLPRYSTSDSSLKLLLFSSLLAPAWILLHDAEWRKCFHSPSVLHSPPHCVLCLLCLTHPLLRPHPSSLLAAFMWSDGCLLTHKETSSPSPVDYDMCWPC